MGPVYLLLIGSLSSLKKKRNINLGKLQAYYELMNQISDISLLFICLGISALWMVLYTTKLNHEARSLCVFCNTHFAVAN